MNLFYEAYPDSINVAGEYVPIVTDFRSYIHLIDVLKDDNVKKEEKAEFLCAFFKIIPRDIERAVSALFDFINMKPLLSPANKEDGSAKEIPVSKAVYSFRYDYAYILAGFLQCYQINLNTVDYMHWWEFRCLFNGLSADTEIKQRIHYRSIDASKIKDKKERQRIRKIQEEIRLPGEEISDYEIGNAFM